LRMHVTTHVRPCFSLFLWFGSVHAIHAMWINHWINHWITPHTLSFLSHAIQWSRFLNCMNELHESLNVRGWPAKGRRCIGKTTLPPSWPNCFDIWERQPPWTFRACPGMFRDYFTFTLLR
jgi:hypothetical protein